MTGVSVAIDVITFVCSMVGASFVAGARAGFARAELISIGQRLAKIEGMFELRLRQDQGGGPLA